MLLRYIRSKQMKQQVIFYKQLKSSEYSVKIAQNEFITGYIYMGSLS